MTRWISGLIIAPLLVCLLLYTSAQTLQGVIVVLAMLASWEYFSLAQKGVSKYVIGAGVVLCGLGAGLMMFWVESAEHLMSVMAGAVVLTLLLHFRGHPDFEERIKNMAFFYFGLMYCALLFSYLGWVRDLDHWEFWMFVMLVCTFSSDTGAYVAGRLMGKHKLAPGISPGKTIEGLVGGWVFAVGTALIIRFLFWPDFELGSLLILATLIAFVGPLGDLSESLIKRGVHAKDSGSLIPGHGGLLDRVDALLFTAPVVYYYAKYFS